MIIEPKIKEIYTEIQRQIFYLIPEKWNKVYLYSSIIEYPGKIETGELYFYYIPQGILKRQPVNVYEIPGRFSIAEEQFLRLVEKLYKEIKELQKVCKESGYAKWNHIIISIADFKFMVEYMLEDMYKPEFTSYEKHLIFRYRYLEYPLSSFNHQEKDVIMRYLMNGRKNKKIVKTYSEPMYEKPFETIEIGSKNSNIQFVKEDDIRLLEEKTDFRSQILKSN